MMTKVLTIAVVAALAAPAFAQKWGGTEPGAMTLSSPIAPQAAKPLPEMNGVVSWRTLAQVEPVKVKNKVVPQFSDAVTALSSKEVRINGFMMPLETGNQQKHFLLSAMPVTCGFCMPGGPEALVEVRARVGVKHSFEPVLVAGKLEVLRDDPAGLYYRLTDARPVAK